MSGGGPTAPMFASEQTAAAGPRTLTRYAREKAGVRTVAVVPAGPAAHQQSTEPKQETCGRARVERRGRDTGTGITVTLLVGVLIGETSRSQPGHRREVRQRPRGTGSDLRKSHSLRDS